jgi:hypothetical protein
MYGLSTSDIKCLLTCLLIEKGNAIYSDNILIEAECNGVGGPVNRSVADKQQGV